MKCRQRLYDYRTFMILHWRTWDNDRWLLFRLLKTTPMSSKVQKSDLSLIRNLQASALSFVWPHTLSLYNLIRSALSADWRRMGFPIRTIRRTDFIHSYCTVRNSGHIAQGPECALLRTSCRILSCMGNRAKSWEKHQSEGRLVLS